MCVSVLLVGCEGEGYEVTANPDVAPVLSGKAPTPRLEPVFAVPRGETPIFSGLSLGRTDELFSIQSSAPFWQSLTGNSSNDVLLGVTTDASGNVYATGIFSGTLSFGGACLALSSTADTALFVAKFSVLGACVWATSASGGTSSDDAAASAIALDSLGNVYVAGSFEGSLVTPAARTSIGGLDVIFAKYTSSGSLSWLQTEGGTSDDLAYAIAIDGVDVVIAGAFGGGATFGGPTNLTSNGGADIFIAGYTTATGSFAFADAWGGTGYDAANGLAVDGLGQIWLTGSFTGTANLGEATSLTSNGGSDIFLATYSAAGLFAQVSAYGGVGNDSGVALVVDSSGAPRIAGYFQNAMTIGTALTGSGTSTAFVAAFSALDAPSWARALDSSAGAYGEAIAVDSSSNVYVTGRYGGIGADDLGGITASGTTDFYLASYTSTGSPRWLREAGTSGPTESTALSVSSAGVAVGGSFSGALSCGLGSTSTSGVFLCDVPTSTLVVGDAQVTAALGSLTAGYASAFTFAAAASGPVDNLSAYIDSTSTASSLVVGLYSAGGSSPGTLLTSGTIVSPSSGWNTVNVSTTSLTSGTTYWIALLVPKSATGTGVFHQQGALGTTSVGALSTTLLSLPTTWASGLSGSAGPVSAFGAN